MNAEKEGEANSLFGIPTLTSVHLLVSGRRRRVIRLLVLMLLVVLLLLHRQLLLMLHLSSVSSYSSTAGRQESRTQTSVPPVPRSARRRSSHRLLLRLLLSDLRAVLRVVDGRVGILALLRLLTIEASRKELRDGREGDAALSRSAGREGTAWRSRRLLRRALLLLELLVGVGRGSRVASHGSLRVGVASLVGEERRRRRLSAPR